VAISVGLPVAVNNPVSASQVGRRPHKWINLSVEFNAFASKAATNAMIVGTSVMI